MRIYEVSFYNDEPTDGYRSGPQLDSRPAPFGDDPANLAHAFTRSGLVKHFWNLNGSEGQPSGPAPPNPETALIPNGTSEPGMASWEAEPLETESSVGQHRLIPTRRSKGFQAT
jgi:hypothetical protein